MKLYGLDKKEMLTVAKLEVLDGQLIIRGKIYGTMPLVAVLRPEEVRAALKLLTWKTFFFLLSMPFRRAVKPKSK